MNRFENQQFKQELRIAIKRAIEAVGLSVFKKTSFFQSNDPVKLSPAPENWPLNKKPALTGGFFFAC